MTSTVDLVHTVKYGHRQRDLALFTNKTLTAVTICYYTDTNIIFVTNHRNRYVEEY